MTNTKHTPKSCSCSGCSRGKHSKWGREMLRIDERAYRHAAKISLTKLDEDYESRSILSAPIGNYYD